MQKTGIMTYSKSIKLFINIVINFILFIYFIGCEILNLHGVYHYSTEIWQHQSESESLHLVIIIFLVTPDCKFDLKISAA